MNEDDYEIKNLSCTECGSKCSIKMNKEKFKIWIRDDIELCLLFPEMTFNSQLLLTKGICAECSRSFSEDFIGNLTNE